MIRQSRHIHNLLPELFTSFFYPVHHPSLRGYFLCRNGRMSAFFRLHSHEIISNALVDASMVDKRRFSSEVAVKFSRKDPYILHLRLV